MAFRPATCPSCNKSIQIPDDADVAICMYCAQSVVVKDAVQMSIGPNVTNLLALARTAGVAGNYQEAYAYYNRVLELDPINAIAWFGKAEAAGWLSTLASMRVSEMFVGFQNAILHSHGSDRDSMSALCADTLNRLAVTLYGIARKHMLEYVALPSTWPAYVGQVSELITAFEMAHAWKPTDRAIIENVIHLCQDNIEGVRYNDPYQNNASKAVFLSDAYEAELRGKLNEYAEKLQCIDPDYVAPDPVRQQPGCFVVTATMGDSNHPNVVLLRQLRDDVIARTRLGRAFIAWYYRHGPKAARVIARAAWRKKVAFLMIVQPLSFLARAVLRK
ncbi:hypothetical protein E4K72_00195 [Oxalobacteraceae bacterium OM1]|nr:hypothetical protein E4K72_00195 [Oxalobacteraceae bacterium OM1]